MSIASELTRIQTAKADIKTAIEAKGVTVPSSATIDTYDDYITSIPSGGGGSSADTEALKGMIQRNITSLVIPSGVTSIGDYAFFQCSSLSSVTIPNSVTSIGDFAFDGCGFTTVTIPSGVTSIGEAAFSDCTSLTSVTVEATTPPTLNGYSFESTNDCPIYVPAASVEIYKTTENWSEYASRIQAIPE